MQLHRNYGPCENLIFYLYLVPEPLGHFLKGQHFSRLRTKSPFMFCERGVPIFLQNFRNEEIGSVNKFLSEEKRKNSGCFSSIVQYGFPSTFKFLFIKYFQIMNCSDFLELRL